MTMECPTCGGTGNCSDVVAKMVVEMLTACVQLLRLSLNELKDKADSQAKPEEAAP